MYLFSGFVEFAILKSSSKDKKTPLPRGVFILSKFAIRNLFIVKFRIRAYNQNVNIKAKLEGEAS